MVLQGRMYNKPCTIHYLCFALIISNESSDVFLQKNMGIIANNRIFTIDRNTNKRNKYA